MLGCSVTWTFAVSGGIIIKKLAFCGNDCSECPRYIATEKGDISILEKVAELWNRLGWRDTIVSPKEISCHGCSTSCFCSYGIQQCASNKEIDNCGMCTSYPCDLSLKSFEQTKIYSESIKGKCNDEDYQRCYVAFFLKKDYLDNARS